MMMIDAGVAPVVAAREVFRKIKPAPAPASGP
jgi:hypothetical protein